MCCGNWPRPIFRLTRWLTTFACNNCWRVPEMRREKKIAQRQERWLALQEERRLRKMKQAPREGRPSRNPAGPQAGGPHLDILANGGTSGSCGPSVIE